MNASVLVLVVRPEQGDADALVVDLDARTPWRLIDKATNTGHVDLAAYLYDCPLSDLGLEPGTHKVTTTAPGRSLPAGATQLVSAFDGNLQAPWTPVQASSRPD